MSRHEAWGLWEGGVGWGSPSSGARVKKQGKAGWARGWGAIGTACRGGFRKTGVPIADAKSLRLAPHHVHLWSAYGVPQCQGMPVKVSAHSSIVRVTVKAEPLLPSGPDSCPSLENALWSLVAGHSSTQMLGQGRSQGFTGKISGSPVPSASAMTVPCSVARASVDLLVCH